MSRYMENIGGRIVEAALVAVAAGLEASAQALLRRNDSIALQRELLDLVQLGEDGRVTFQNIKISEHIGLGLISLACVQLKRNQFSTFASRLPAAASQPILLSGPEGNKGYHQLVVKALAHYFEAKLLILDVTNLASKSTVAIWRHNIHVVLKEEIFVDALFKVLGALSETSPVVVYFPDAPKNLYFECARTYSLFLTKMQKLSGSIMILGSRIKPMDDRFENREMIDELRRLFCYNFNVRHPKDHAGLSQLEETEKTIQAQDNRMLIMDVLHANSIDCEDISSLEFGDSLRGSIKEFVFFGVSHHLMNVEQPEYRDGMLLISAKSLIHALASIEPGKLDSNKPKTQNEMKGIEPDNGFEKKIRQELIPPGEIGVNFQDIGALENVKESLRELVMLPLRRPEFFNRGGFIKPCKGILLFGPPGTGKTMLAKAVATEAGASFINVCMSTITSSWQGEDQKYVRALFTLAAKVAPTVIFIDEVDSMLGKRSSSGEHETLRVLKNEFMAHWDGLLTKGGKYVLVLAATNRPFDLDEAITRRFERRIMVGLPDPENREKILRTILSKEELGEDFNFEEVAAMTEGYSGSDLKNLCIAAAYRQLSEHLSNDEEENHETFERKKDSTYFPSVATLRPLSTEDIKEAKKQVSASFAIDGAGMQELKDWNDLYGEGGSKPKQQLTYFL